MIKEILLVHHTHTDFGYTDLPGTCWDLHVGYIEQAIQCCQRAIDYPEAARFRWTCEVLWPVQRFLETASSDLRRRFDRLFDEGYIDVAAMPFNTTSLIDQHEWNALRRDLSPLYERYRPAVAMQNDINGLPWGILPLWREAGVKTYMTGPNGYSGGGQPLAPPAVFWWEAADGHRLLTSISSGYCDGYFYFHDSEWRRGPIPSATDIWFNPPGPGDVFDPSPAGLKKSAAVCRNRIAGLPKDYPFDVLPLQVTNMWRFDNDPPQPNLSDFVRAWNDAGLQPFLRLATARQVGEALQSRAVSASLPVLRGDWCDWWADIITSAPTEVACSQNSKRRLVDLPATAEMFSSQWDGLAPATARAWRNVSIFTEHTPSGFDSVAQPYRPLNLGHSAEHMGPIYAADEQSQMATAEVMRHSPLYCPLSRTRSILVMNPGDAPRSGWVNISARAIRHPANAVRDNETGQVYPLEDIREQVWGTPKPDANLPFEVPNDAWPWDVTVRRFRPGILEAKQLRRFTLVEIPVPAIPTAPDDGNSSITWEWDAARGLPSRLRLSGGQELIDSTADFALGQVVIDDYPSFAAREDLLSHQRERVEGKRQRVAPQCRQSFVEPSHYGSRFHGIFEHPNTHRIAQCWALYEKEQRLELTTTFWLKEHVPAQVIYIAFPLLVPDAVAAYDAMGQTTRVGIDQIPGTCGEYHVVRGGVSYTADKLSVTLATPDTPLGCFDAIDMRTGRKSFVPSTARFFTLVHSNLWVTNAPVTKAAKLVVRHVIGWATSDQRLASAAALAGELKAMPCNEAGES